MARIALTEAFAADIVARPKRIDEDIRWYSDPDLNYFKAVATAQTEARILLKVHLNVNRTDRRKISVTLVASRAYPILRLDVNGSHQNRHTDDARWHQETHKHRWTDACRDALAYTPPEQIPDDPEGVFREFCMEANIDFRGNFGNFP